MLLFDMDQRSLKTQQKSRRPFSYFFASLRLKGTTSEKSDTADHLHASSVCLLSVRLFAPRPSVCSPSVCLLSVCLPAPRPFAYSPSVCLLPVRLPTLRLFACSPSICLLSVCISTPQSPCPYTTDNTYPFPQSTHHGYHAQ